MTTDNIFTYSIPSQVSVMFHSSRYELQIQGPVGSITINTAKLVKTSIAFKLDDDKICFYCSEKDGGTLGSHIEAAFVGVTTGYSVFLDIVGVGFRALLDEKTQILQLKLGLTYSLSYEAPPQIRLFLLRPTRICVFGASKELVTAVAARIRALKPPEPYKGKGIRLSIEEVKIKEGKRK